jgi:hypothetical protein
MEVVRGREWEIDVIDASKVQNFKWLSQVTLEGEWVSLAAFVSECFAYI